MKLQVALDTLTLEEALRLLEKIEPFVDIVEVGTPFLIEAGLNPVREIKKRYPHMTVLADVKIIDGASIEAKSAFEAGADIVTVIGLAHEQTIQDTIDSAKMYQKEVLVDFIASDVPSLAKRLEPLGADYFCVHTAVDVQAQKDGPLAELIALKKTVSVKTAVAGGVHLDSIEEIAKQYPDILIVGSAITKADDPCMVASRMKEIILGYSS